MASFLPRFALLSALAALLILDVFLTGYTQSSPIAKSISYVVRFSLALFIEVAGIYYLWARRNPQFLVVLYLGNATIVTYWLFSWATSQSAWSLVTIILHPSFSVFSWFFFLTMLVSCHNGQVFVAAAALMSNNLYIIFLATVAAIAAPHYFGVTFFYPPLILTLCYSAILKIDIIDRIMASLLLILIVIAMLVTSDHYRTYVAASILTLALVWTPYYHVRAVRNCIYAVLLSVPVLYSLLTGYLVEHQNTTGLYTDTRTFLFDELVSDLSSTDLFFGRGLDGSYYSPYFYHIATTGYDEQADSYMRSGSEVGWLNLILKFGCLGLFTFVLLLARHTLIGPRKREPLFVASQKFCMLAFFIFLVEMPNQIDYSHCLWYISLGYLLAGEVPRGACRASRSSKRTAFSRTKEVLPGLANGPSEVHPISNGQAA